VIVMIKEPIIVKLKYPTALPIPIAIAQNIKTRSTGSFIGVLNLTIDRAPTMPRERIKLPLIIIMTIVTTMAIAISETLKLL
jgi:hypothetical protein